MWLVPDIPFRPLFLPLRPSLLEPRANFFVGGPTPGGISENFSPRSIVPFAEIASGALLPRPFIKVCFERFVLIDSS